MKYRSITLNGNKDHIFSLVKYNEVYKEYLEEFRKINCELADCVEQCPKIYSELSEHQCYMIFRDECHYVGAIYIGTSTDEKNLEIKLQFDEKYFESKNEIFIVIEQIIDSLGLYLYDKENIEIDLINDIDLSLFNKFKYKKKVYDEKKTTYTCTNKQNNILIPRLITEIRETEKKLIDWRQSWMQKFCNYQDCSNIFDKQLMAEYRNGTVSLQELFYKIESLLWTNINSTREILFSRNGQISLKKRANDLEGINYDFNYNVLSDGFRLNAYVFNKKTLEISEDRHSTKIKSGNIEIFNIKEYKRKKFNYISPIVNKSSISIELWFNERDEIENCYVDFRTHKGNGKINGLYALRIIPGYFSTFSLNFIRRKGDKEFDFSYMLPTNLFSAIIPSDLTIDLVDEIICKSIPIINQMASTKHRQLITLENNCIVSNITDIETQVISFIKKIKEEIPLPCLQENLQKFIEEHDKSKKDDLKKLLKK